MATVPEELLQTIATRVAKQVRDAATGSTSWPARFVLLVLSGEGDDVDATLAGLASTGEPIVGVADCPTAAAGALAAARARVPSMRVIADEPNDLDALVGRAVRAEAPAMDLALASRVAALQGETPGARILLRALFAGVPVHATLDARDFRVSERAPEGARRALEQVEARLRALGLAVGPRVVAPGPPTGTPVHHVSLPRPTAVSLPHPSQERFELPKSVNEFVEYLEHRGCTIEPGKPCIDCGACETRGF
jgi:hypothetical protein